MASEKEREDLKELIYNLPEIRDKINHRDKNFESGQHVIGKLESATVPEPNYKIQGGPTYKNANYKEQINRNLKRLEAAHHEKNQEIHQKAREVFDREGYPYDLREYDIIELIDEKIEEKGYEYKATNDRVNNYLSKRGHQPENNYRIEKSDFKETPSLSQDRDIEQDYESNKIQSWDKNKQDMEIEAKGHRSIEQDKGEIDREPDI